nr:MAG TPA: hypothetical protein [Caudoviricetes sp.]
MLPLVNNKKGDAIWPSYAYTTVSNLCINLLRQKQMLNM